RNFDPVRRLRHVTPHETAFRADELRRRFEEEDFLVEVCEPFEFLHPRTPAWLVSAALSLERGLEATPARAIAGSLLIAGTRRAR
ncbi:MAG: hypothetical protein ABI783_11725, partial [Actinomycetota bacterium]